MKMTFLSFAFKKENVSPPGVKGKWEFRPKVRYFIYDQSNLPIKWEENEHLANEYSLLSELKTGFSSKQVGKINTALWRELVHLWRGRNLRS